MISFPNSLLKSSGQDDGEDLTRNLNLRLVKKKKKSSKEKEKIMVKI
jgi:hypothetical protein